LVAIKKLTNIQIKIPIRLKCIASNDAPSFAISLIDEAITLKGNACAMGCIRVGKDEIGKNIPERINWGSVKSKAMGRMAS
jgi:hypothetical protein